MPPPTGLRINAGVTVNAGVTLNGFYNAGPSVNTANDWAFDPDHLGNNLELGSSSAGANTTVTATYTEESIVLGSITLGRSLYDYAEKVMYSVKVTDEDLDDVPLNLAHIGFAYQYVDLNTALGDDVSGYGIGWCQNGEIHYAGSIAQSELPTYGPGDRLDIAVDLGYGSFWVRVNGGLWNGNGSSDPASGLNGISLQMPGNGTAGSGSALYPAVNPGAFNFTDAMAIQTKTYSIPTGFIAL